MIRDGRHGAGLRDRLRIDARTYERRQPGKPTEPGIEVCFDSHGLPLPPELPATAERGEFCAFACQSLGDDFSHPPDVGFKATVDGGPEEWLGRHTGVMDYRAEHLPAGLVGQ